MDTQTSQTTPLAAEDSSIATRNSSDIRFERLVIAILTLTLSAKAGATATYTLKVQGKKLDGTYYDLWTAAAAVSNNGTYVYALSPFAAFNVGGVVESKLAALPKSARVVLVVASGDGANNCATQVDADFIPAT